MTVEWIEPIYNRTYGDVLQAEADRDIVNPKGCYNYIDLNRIENNTKYVMENMIERKIIKVPPSLAIKLNWAEKDIPTREDMIRIIQNVRVLMDLSNPEITDTFDIIYESTQFTYTLANAIEKNLVIMKNQPELPVQKWLLQLENGIIEESGTSSMYLAEEEIVHIQGLATGENAQYMLFTNWSGDTDDLQYVGNVNSQNTTYQMSYHDDESYVVNLTANFKTRFPRTLTLHGGTIYDDIGGTTRQLFAGDEILILANTSEPGKRFYEWRGTEEGLENLTGGEQPSTSWLTMPDCDVELTAFYINAGQHSVKVDGEIQGWYDYDEYVSIYPKSKGEKYSFSYWSGDTGYLDDVTSTSFKMPDVNVEFTSNWSYNYSYNTVTMINGTINGVKKGENLREGSGQSISADQAPNGYVFYRWELEGLGSFDNIKNSTTTFYVGDGNAIITATYTKAGTVTIENENNNGGSRTIIVGEGNEYSISTDEVLSDYMFDYWERDGIKYNTSSSVSKIVMGGFDVTYRAVYRTRNSYDLNVINGSGSGKYKERQSVRISANQAQSGYEFLNWSGNYYSIVNRNNETTSITMPSENCEVVANYEEIKIYHNLTVNYGKGSGRYYEEQSVFISGNQEPETYEFDEWEINSGDGTIANYLLRDTQYTMGTEDGEITAKYKPIPYFNVTVINGKLSDGSTEGTFLRNSSPRIIMDPAPEGQQFLQWEVIEGDDNDITEPLSENTTIRNLTHNVTVQATYYVPNTEIKYTLTITGKNGEITTYNYPVGEQIDIYADTPDEGYVFVKWTGDVQYVNDRYAEKAVVNMPPKNIELGMKYEQEGYVTKYHVKLYGGELLVETREDGTEVWDIESEFEEGTVVKIRAIDIPSGWKFNGWKNDDDNGLSMSTVKDLMKEETTLTVQDFGIELTRDIIEKDKYSLSIINGEVSGSYYDGEPVSVYFNLENTDNTHYSFIRWSGNDLAYIKLFDGSSFDVFNPGTADEPQVIKMPARKITITGTYNASYKLSINNVEKGYYSEGEKINISAEEIEGKRFLYWEGNTEYVDNKYNPNIVVTMPNGAINLIPKYHNTNDNNYIGYTLTDLISNDNINKEDITPISGEISNGYIITDINGHIYVITNIVDNVCNLKRLTKIQGGDEDGQ